MKPPSWKGLVAVLSLLAAGARAESWGNGYASFDLKPTLPKAAGHAPAVKVVYMMSDDATIWAGGKQTMLALLKEQQANPAKSFVFLERPGAGGGAQLLQLGDAQGAGWRSALAPGIRQVQSNNPDLLAKVLRWAYSGHTAPRRYLEYDGHGLGAFGLGTDQHQVNADGTSLKDPTLLQHLPELARALQQGTAGQAIDLLFFNACDMASIEVLTELAPTVRRVVASEIGVIADGRGVLVGLPLAFEEGVRRGDAPAAIAQQLVYSAMGRESGYLAIASLDLTQSGALVSAMDALAGTLIAAFPRHRDAIVHAYDSTPLLEEVGLGDLKTFLSSAARIPDARVQAAVRAAQGAFTRVVVSTWRKSDQQVGGLSIYMPRKAGKSRVAYLESAYVKTAFAKKTRWLQFAKMAAAAIPRA